MKKIFALLIFTLCALSIWAEDFEVDGIYYNILTDKTNEVEVTYQYKGSSNNYSYLTTALIPETVTYNGTTYSVTSIGSSAFYYCKGLTSVTIGNSVTSIGKNAFYYCKGLTSVTIGNSVTSIGEDAFSDCYGLTSITIPNSVTSIGNMAFSDCSGLTSVTIGNSVTTIGSAAFYGCSGMTSVIIPNSVTTIEKRAFYNCKGLTSVTIPNSVTSIGSEVFYNCSSLTSITIGNSVTTIGDYAFYNCTGLTSIAIPNRVRSIGQHAFSDCSGLTSVTIGNSVMSIGSSAFSGCSGLTSITIPNSVTSIKSDAFSNCFGVISIVWKAKNYADFSSYDVAPFYNIRSNITSFTFGDSVQHIPANLCYGMRNLTSITIPSSVTSIGSSAFSGCSGLKSVVWNAKNVADFSSNSYAPFYNIRSQITTFTFGDSVQHIPANLCYGMRNLTSITIPSSVTSIGNSAFYNCSGLTSVTIPNSVTSIGRQAFYDCSGLTSVTIGNSVTTIGEKAFLDCSGLTSVIIPNSVTSIGNYAFYNCSGLTSVTIGNSVTTIGDYAFFGCSGLTSVTIGSSVMGIGEKAFYNCKGLTSITIPNSVTTIGDYAFYGCSGLSSITIPNGVTNIGDCAFDECSNLISVIWNAKNYPDTDSGSGTIIFYNIRSQITTFTFGDSVQYIPANLCYEMKNLDSVSIGKNVKSINSRAFSNSSGVTSVVWNAKNVADFSSNSYPPFYNISNITSFTFGDSVQHIPANLCYGMRNLTSITIPSSVTTIGDYAFYGCSGLTSVTWNAKNVADFSSNSYAPFYNSSNITSFTFGDSVQHIPAFLCYNMSKLTSVTIPNSVTSIEYAAFAGCTGLTSITIPNSVTTIGDYAFSDCSGLTSVTIGSSVMGIGEKAFYNCIGLTSITIPNSITSIGSSAFSGCSGLTSVTIGSSVMGIGEKAFYNCTGLTSITIPNSVTSIGDRAFYGCSGLTSVVWNAKNVADFSSSDAAPFYKIRSSITSFTFGNSVQHIPAYLCYGMSNLTSITIPNSVTSIGDYAFYGCSGLAYIESLAEVPPTLGYGTYSSVSENIPVYVPCGSIAAYQSAEGWNVFTKIQGPLGVFSIVVAENDDKMGTARVDKNTMCDDSQISATAWYGYHFVQWNDGNTDNPRAFVLTQDTTFTAEFAPNKYSITTNSTDSERGTTQGDMTVNYLENVTISATANYGYHFAKWNDGNTDNPRVVQVTEDKTYTAQFDKNIYSITTDCNNNQIGSVNAPKSAMYLDQVTISATAKYGYHFVQWSDGNADNPRVLVLTQDTTLIAEFALTIEGQCGDNLYWAYNEVSKTVSITGSGDMYNYTKSSQPWSLFQDQITEVTTSNATTSIGKYAFAGCVRLSKVSLGIGMENIAANAFAECKRLYDIYCYATYPPFAEESSFANYNVYLYVPCESKRDYELDVVWGEFKFIECIGAESDETGGDDVTVTPGTNDVTITWPTDNNADTYSIVITKDGEVVCTLTFNSNGQLVSIAFAPGREGNHPAQYAEAANKGYRFTVTGLEESTKYAYNIDVKDAANKTIQSYSGEFTTKSATGVEDIVISDGTTQKLLRDGQLLIIRDGKTYTVMGQEVK